MPFFSYTLLLRVFGHSQCHECHFLYYTFWLRIFGQGHFQEVPFCVSPFLLGLFWPQFLSEGAVFILRCGHAHFQDVPFCALHRFVTFFLATPIVKIVLTKRCKIQNGPLKNDCGHKSPNQIVQGKKWRPLKITVAKKSSQNCQIQNGTSQK